MSSHEQLVGRLQVRPGRSRPDSLTNTRRALAGLLLTGRPVEAAPRMLHGLFTLCGHAHALCATLALAAAHGQEAPASNVQQRALQAETARDHALRICLDWPGMMAGNGTPHEQTASAQASLRCLPAWGEGIAFTGDAAAWLSRLLGISPSAWLAAWENDSASWLSHWCMQEGGWLPTLLRSCRPFAQRPLEAAPPLRPHARADDLRTLAHEMAGAFDTIAPTWRGTCVETGTWTRLHGTAHACLPKDAWDRLGARIAELARLVLPDAPGCRGTGWLAAGSMAVGPGEGLGWVEMARGLLIHRARIEGPPGSARVAGYDVLAPTDWNFHSQGAVARSLETMAPDLADTPRHVRTLMAAYDPCVRFDIETCPTIPEYIHA